MGSSRAPSSNKQTLRRQLVTFKGLKPSQFQHTADASATATLKAIPGLDFVVAKVLEHGLERALYLANIASNVRVTNKMFPRLHKSLVWACRILDVAEPELYVQTDPMPNAWTFGHTRPFITLTTGLVDSLGDEERLFVIGHELGHIKAGHVLYTTLAMNLAVVTSLIAQATLGAGRVVGASLELAIREWGRAAELTADRAGLLCTQSFKPCARAFMKLAGGVQGLHAEMNVEEFMRQVHVYDGDASVLGKVYKTLLVARRSHPFTVMRAKELATWRESGYVALLKHYQ